jgi:hypothetical protein
MKNGNAKRSKLLHRFLALLPTRSSSVNKLAAAGHQPVVLNEAESAAFLAAKPLRQRHSETQHMETVA